MRTSFPGVVERAFTVRAIVIGAFLSIFLNLACQLICGGFWMAWDFFHGIVKDFVYIGVP
jgi:hypothetical protein